MSTGTAGGQTTPLGSGEGSRSGRAPNTASRTGFQKGLRPRDTREHHRSGGASPWFRPRGTDLPLH
eukprot:4438132-Pyramimonas_sp.AAC.1